MIHVRSRCGGGGAASLLCLSSCSPGGEVSASVLTVCPRNKQTMPLEGVKSVRRKDVLQIVRVSQSPSLATFRACDQLCGHLDAPPSVDALVRRDLVGLLERCLWEGGHNSPILLLCELVKGGGEGCHAGCKILPISQSMAVNLMYPYRPYRIISPPSCGKLIPIHSSAHLFMVPI